MPELIEDQPVKPRHEEKIIDEYSAA